MKFKIAERVGTVRDMGDVVKYLEEKYGDNAKVLSYHVEIESDNGLVFTLEGQADSGG